MNMINSIHYAMPTATLFTSAEICREMLGYLLLALRQGVCTRPALQSQNLPSYATKIYLVTERVGLYLLCLTLEHRP